MNATPSSTVPEFKLGDTERKELLERFLRYARINTRSSETSETFPSSTCQFDLLRLLEKELKEIGLQDVGLDEYGYLFATLPSNLPEGITAPVVGYLSHVDTYCGTNSDNVKPQVIEDYRGGDIALPGNADLKIAEADNPLLGKCHGHTLITADGTTLLGADDKAGVAEIVTMMDWLVRHPEVPHGTVRVGFTPDEETGNGTRFFNVERFDAMAAYTFDGSELGEIEDETFCGDSATVTITGLDIHPGKAKDRMINALRVGAYLIDRLPGDYLPETTEKRQSYVHPYVIGGEVGKVEIKFIVRGFTVEDLRARENDLLAVARDAESAFPGAKVEVLIQESYRNMKVILDKYPQVLKLAEEAIRRAGADPIRSYIRGGTDGSALCFKGLPTPNIFAGGANFHGLKEWASLDWMLKAVETGLHLTYLWGCEKQAP